MTDNDHIQWLKDRQKGIGGSDAGAILGVNPYSTPLDVYESKVSTIRGDDPITWQMLMGNVLEPVAAELYSLETGRVIRRQPQRAHPDYDFILGNVDRQILAVGDVESTGIAEIKCPQIQTIAYIKAHGLPSYMVAQLHHYLAVYNYSWGSFILFNQNAKGLIHFDMEADQEFIALLIKKEVEFWNNHVVPRIPPTLEDQEEIEIPQVEGELTIVNTPEWFELANDLQEAQSLKKSAQTLEDLTKDKIKELMHHEEIHAAEVAGFARFYYKPYPGKTSWKKTAEAIAREANLNPNDYIVEGKPYTRFNAFFLKKGD
jgi:putative phage-type endonuclease